MTGITRRQLLGRGAGAGAALLGASTLLECSTDPAPTVPSPQSMPRQEPGTRPRRG